jgi:hypothetical protein
MTLLRVPMTKDDVVTRLQLPLEETQTRPMALLMVSALESHWLSYSVPVAVNDLLKIPPQYNGAFLGIPLTGRVSVRRTHKS